MKPLVLAAAALATLAAPASAQGRGNWDGIWRNAANTVRIRAARCGAGRDSGMCGRVIWASARARDDAARGGTDRLVGTELFHDFRRGDDGLWYGEVYVPDIDKTFQGTIALDGPDTIVGTGCLFGNFGCKSQTWTRVK